MQVVQCIIQIPLVNSQVFQPLPVKIDLSEKNGVRLLLQVLNLVKVLLLQVVVLDVLLLLIFKEGLQHV